MNPVLHFNMLRRRSRTGLMISLGLLALLVLAGQMDAASGRWLAWAASCAALVFAIHQLPGMSRVTLDAEGISIRSPFWKQRLDWRNVQRFVLVQPHQGDPEGPVRQPWIGYLVNERQRLATPEEVLRIFEPLGCHGLLPNVNDIAPEDMVTLLNGVLRLRRAEAAARR